MSGPITTLVFDIGEVLLDWNPRYLFRKIFDDEARMERFMEETGFHEWNRELDRGRLFGDAVAELAARFPDHADVIGAFDARWPETVGGHRPESVALLERLRAKGWPNYAITNFSGEKFKVACALYPFLAGFDGVVVSGDEKLIKPDRAIFDVFLTRYAKRAEECLFVDDNAHNIAAAEALGFPTVHFTGPEMIEAAFAAHGVR